MGKSNVSIQPARRKGPQASISSILALAVALGVLACSSQSNGPQTGTSGAGIGGELHAGGSTAGASTNPGGTRADLGGSSAAGSSNNINGGSTSSGGSIATGGSRSTSISSGGSIATGGSRSTSISSGGSIATGGSSSTSISSGGSSSISSGGSIATGGSGGTAGTKTSVTTTASSGGQTSTSGGASSGGALPGTGGKSTGGASSPTGGTAAVGSGGSTAYNPCPTTGDACKILPIGDSITHGLQSTDSAGYRSRLFELVVAANQNVMFTGSQSSGPDKVSGKSFPKNHEGHDGWTVDPNYSKYGSGGISSLVPSPAFDTMPNIVLLMIGTNDITSTSDPGGTANRLDSLLDKIASTAPSSLIVVAMLTPVSWSSTDLNNYNAKIPTLVQTHAAKGQHIACVDMSKMPTSDLASDGVHPNDQGYTYMANVWYQAIKSLLPQ